MERGFQHTYQPVIYLHGSPEPYDEDHKKNWIADREYQYYQEHKDSVDAFGTMTEAMKMSQEEHEKLVEVLQDQNEERKKVVDEWRAGLQDNKKKKQENKHKNYIQEI